MASNGSQAPVVIDWKQLVIYLALGVGLFLLAYELIELAAIRMGIENQGRGRGTLFGVAALALALPVLRLLVRWLDFMPDPPKRPD